MKKLFTILILLTFCVISIIAQVFVNPVFDRTDTPEFHIEKIEITTDTTFIICSYSAKPDSWASVSPKIYLYDYKTHIKYPLLKCKGIPLYPLKQTFKDYTNCDITLCFSSVTNMSKFDLIEDINEKAFNVHGINIDTVPFNKKYKEYELNRKMLQRNFYYDSGNHEKALPLSEEIVEGCKYLYGIKSEEVLISLNLLSYSCHYLGNIDKAIKYIKDSENIAKSIPNYDSDKIIEYNEILSVYYNEMGEYQTAINILNSTAEQIMSKYGENDIKYAEILIKLSKNSNDLGNYSQALQHALHAKEILLINNREENDAYVRCLSNLSTAQSNLGLYEDAIQTNLNGFTINATITDSYNVVNALFFQNISYNYGELSKYTDAITYGEKAYSLYNAHSVKNSDFVSLLSNLSLYYFNLATIKNTESSDSLFKKALNYLDEAYSTAMQLNDNRTLAHVLNCKAWAQYMAGLKEDSYSSLQKACKLSNRYTMECFTYYQNLEHFYLENGSYESALIIQNGTFPNFISRIKENLISIPMDAIKSYWNSRSIYSWLYYTIPQCAFLTQNVEAISELYNTLLLSKGFLLNADLRIKKSVFEEGDSCNVYYMNRMIEIRKKIIADYERNIVLEDLEKEYAECENKLINNSRAYRDYTTNFVTNWIQVQENLGERDIAVEFVRFSVKERIVYAALLLKREYNSPKLIPLFLEEEYQDSLNQEEKYNLIWKPIEEELYNISNIYFSPDGLLYSVGIEYLINNNGQCLHEKYNVYRLSSTKELINNKQGAKYGSAVLFGGIEYELGNEKEDYRQDKINNWNYVSNIHQRSTFDKIENTLSEVQDISTILNYHNIVTKAYTSTNGSEENFKNLSKMKVDIIHIATHGMYVNKEDAMNIKEKWNYRFIVNGKSNRMSEESALTRSFLVMAGGNKLAMHLPYIENDNDGILTALEISELNFKDLEMVVLSACQTGLGDINNEGVIGLLRGFKKAGAHTILMSLDKVDDESTKILMVEFYRNLMGGKTKLESLRNAQKYLRSVENGKYDAPKYWASFIMLDGLN